MATNTPPDVPSTSNDAKHTDDELSDTLECTFLDFWADVYYECKAEPDITLESFRERFWSDECEELMTENEFEEFWRQRWYLEVPCEDVDLDDLMALPYDSLYVEGCKPERYLTGENLDYESCTAQELRRFIMQRGLVDPFPSGLTLKYYYVQVLEKADKEPSFGLMDLPPEMRLLVCRQILTLPKDACPSCNHCEPAILQTCRLINQEATAILYENTIICGASTLQDAQMKLHKSATVHNEIVNCAAATANNSHFNVPKGMNNYPAFLRRITHLHISIHHEIEDGGRVNWSAYFSLNHFLWTLTSFLMEGRSIKRLDITLNLDKKIENVAAGRIVYPLMCLRNVPTVTISGNLPDKVCKKLKATVRGTQPALNTLRYWIALQEETQAHLTLFDSHTEKFDECECGDCDMHNCCFRLWRLLDSVDEARLEGCMSSSLLQNLQARLGLLRSALNDFDMAVFRREVRSMEEKRKVRENLDVTTSNAYRLNRALHEWNGDIENEDAMHAGGIHDWSDDEEVEGEEQEAVMAEDENVSDLVDAAIRASQAP